MTAPGPTHWVPVGIAATPACLRPNGRRGPTRRACGLSCRPVVPRALAGVVRAPSGVQGHRGGPWQRLGWGPAACPRHWEHGCGVVGWRRVLRHERVGVFCAAGGACCGVRRRAGPPSAPCPSRARHATGPRAAERSSQVRWGHAPAIPGPCAASVAMVHGPRTLRHAAARVAPRGWRQSVTGRSGHLHRSPATQQGFAGDGKQPPLVPRCGSFPRLKPSVRLRPEKKDQESRTTTAFSLGSRWKRHGIMNA